MQPFVWPLLVQDMLRDSRGVATDLLDVYIQWDCYIALTYKVNSIPSTPFLLVRHLWQTLGNKNGGAGQCLCVAKSKKEILSIIGQKDKRTLHCPTNGDPCPQANEKTMVTGGDPCIGPHPHRNGLHKKWCGIVLYRTPFSGMCVHGQPPGSKYGLGCNLDIGKPFPSKTD